jgi:serine/threonine protein kinase
VYGLGYRSDGEAPFLIMRYVRGQDLRQAISDYYSRPANAQEFRRLLQAFVGACNGVGFAHSRGVVHRDPKPSNILLGDHGTVFVVDWGLAQLRRPYAGEEEGEVTGVALTEWVDASVTHEGTIMGTPAYMAPEQAEGRQDLVDARTDVYVLGAGLFQLMTGRPPYHGHSAYDTLAAIRSGEPLRARSISPRVSPALDAVCARAMARQPEARYPTASELGQDIQRWLDGEPVSAYPESLVRRWGRWLGTHGGLG